MCGLSEAGKAGLSPTPLMTGTPLSGHLASLRLFHLQNMTVVTTGHRVVLRFNRVNTRKVLERVLVT